jgi:hypothetical protein
MTGVAALYLYAVAVGFTVAGVTGSIWNLVTGERPRLNLHKEPNVFTPVRALTAIINAPVAIFVGGLVKALANPLLGLVLIVTSLGWSFLQGVFILTQFFSLK